MSSITGSFVMTDFVRDFWDKQAAEHGSDDTATAPDHHYRELEISRILPHIEGKSALDVGCGNGYSTLKFMMAYPKKRFVGVDFSNKMIEMAREAMSEAMPTFGAEEFSFQVGDIRSLSEWMTVSGNKPFDTVISERCLINLPNWQEQQDALRQLKSAVKRGGKLILVENTQEGLDNLNKLRLSLSLPKIQTRWHNAYLPQRELLTFLRQIFEVQHIENIGNLYYIISRVVYAKLAAMEGKEPQYDHPINQIASQLPSMSGYHYSPNFMFVLRSP